MNNFPPKVWHIQKLRLKEKISEILSSLIKLCHCFNRIYTHCFNRIYQPHSLYFREHLDFQLLIFLILMNKTYIMCGYISIVSRAPHLPSFLNSSRNFPMKKVSICFRNFKTFWTVLIKVLYVLYESDLGFVDCLTFSSSSVDDLYLFALSYTLSVAKGLALWQNKSKWVHWEVIDAKWKYFKILIHIFRGIGVLLHPFYI